MECFASFITCQINIITKCLKKKKIKYKNDQVTNNIMVLFITVAAQTACSIMKRHCHYIFKNSITSLSVKVQPQ